MSAVQQSAIAGPFPPCPSPKGVTVVSKLKYAPAALRKTIGAQLGPMAEPDESFNPTDVVDPRYPMRRLIVIWNRGNRWVVATELGGVAYSDPIFLYKLDRDNERAQLLDTRTAIERSVCATATEMLGTRS